MKTLITFIIIATLFLTSCNSSDEESSPDTSSAANSDTPLGLDPDSEAIPLDNQSCQSALNMELDLDPITGVFIDDNGANIIVIFFGTILLGNDVITDDDNDFNPDNIDPGETYTIVLEARNADTSAVLRWCQEDVSGAELLEELGNPNGNSADTYTFPPANLEVIASAADDEFGCSSALDRVLNIEYDPNLGIEFIDMGSDGSFDSGTDVEIDYAETVLLGNEIILDNNVLDYEVAIIDRNVTYNLVIEARNADNNAVLGWCQEDLLGIHLIPDSNPTLEINISTDVENDNCIDALYREFNIQDDMDSNIEFIINDNGMTIEINIAEFILDADLTTVINDDTSIDPATPYILIAEVRNYDTGATLGWCQVEIIGADELGGDIDLVIDDSNIDASEDYPDEDTSGDGPEDTSGDGPGDTSSNGPGDTSSDVSEDASGEGSDGASGEDSEDASGEDFDDASGDGPGDASGEDFDAASGDTPDGDTPDEDTSSET